MSFKDALKRARDARPEPVLQPVALGDEIFNVEVSRLDGMEWAAIMAEAPPKDEKGARLGYDVNKAALIACKRHGRLLDDEGEPVDMDVVRDKRGNIIEDPWVDLFTEISGVELHAIASIWWALNMQDPNDRVVALKKASAAGAKTNSK